MRIKTCLLLGLGRVISELSSALASMAGMDWAEERTGGMRKSSETLSSVIAKSKSSCVRLCVRHVMSSGAERMPEEWIWHCLSLGFCPGSEVEILKNAKSSTPLLSCLDDGVQTNLRDTT